VVFFAGGNATGIAVQIVHDNPQRTVHPLNVDAILSGPATGLPVDGEFDFKLRALLPGRQCRTCRRFGQGGDDCASGVSMSTPAAGICAAAATE